LKQNYIQIFKRRRVGKTDYRKRRALIQGRQPFLAVRVSNKYIYGQILRAAPTGDITLCALSSRVLTQKYGWKGSAKNLPSAYLTGFLLGRQSQQNEVSQTSLYTGASRFVHGSKIAAFLKGMKDSGMAIDFDEKILPDEQRLKGIHISNYGKKLAGEDSSRYYGLFSKTISRGLKPDDYPAHFEQVKELIERKGSP
jgi:large subunit ribosomal protein L18